VRRLKGRETVASIVALVIFLLVLIVPFTFFLGIVVSEAVSVSQSVTPWIERQVSEPDRLDTLLQGIPLLDRLAPYQDQIAVRIGEFAGRVGSFLVSKVAAATKGTAIFVFNLFIMLYAMFFFLKNGRSYLERILDYVPLRAEDENRMVEKFVSVTRATLKGTFVIGVVQGGLAGLAFYVVGIEGAAFWGTIMAVLSIIPGVGTALVWVPGLI
jgi:predicted PurR-regulated permease PerM